MRSSTRAVTRPPRRAAIESFDLDVGGERLIVVSLPVRMTAPAAGPQHLTPTELEVARAAMRGLSNAEIAQLRGCQPRTIANQLASIYRKLGVSSRAALAACGLLESAP